MTYSGSGYGAGYSEGQRADIGSARLRRSRRALAHQHRPRPSAELLTRHCRPLKEWTAGSILPWLTHWWLTRAIWAVSTRDLPSVAFTRAG